jgi:response regulator RpfG family c-di-GMP phosphodiesterase
MSSGTSINDLLIVAEEAPLVESGLSIAATFGYRAASCAHVDALVEKPELAQARVILLSALTVSRREEIAGHVQVARQLCPDAFIVCVVARTLSPELAEFMKKSGSNLILIEDEALRTSKIEFICAQTLNSAFLPVKADELKADQIIDFDLFHLLPQRGKFLPCQFEGERPDAARIAKIGAVGELYVRREQAAAFRAYVDRHVDRSAAGLVRRCRAQYLSLTASYVDLIYHLTDRSEHASFVRGQELLKRCQDLAGSFATSLASVGSAWAIINQGSIGAFGSVERAPAVAAYAALFALRVGKVSVDEVMLGALLGDIGLIGLSPKVVRALRESRLDQLSAEDRRDYENHPYASLDLVLSRKLPLSPELRQVILCTHEKSDGSGFPKQLKGKKIPLASEIIQMAEMIDRETCLRMGRARINAENYTQDFMRGQVTSGLFSPELLAKLVG